MIRKSAASRTPRLLDSITPASGILDHPLSRVMTTWERVRRVPQRSSDTIVKQPSSSSAVIASASEAIHRAAKQEAGLLPPSLAELRRTRSSQAPLRKRFAFVAGNDACIRILAARCARARPEIASAHQNERAQGMPGARCTRGLVCKMHKEKRTRAYRFSGGNPAFPARWFYGLFRALPGDRAVLPPSPVKLPSPT